MPLWGLVSVCGRVVACVPLLALLRCIRPASGVYWCGGWHAQGWRGRVAGSVGVQNPMYPHFSEMHPQMYPHVPPDSGTLRRTFAH